MNREQTAITEDAAAPPERAFVDEAIPDEVRDAICALGLAAAGANVIMQLSRLPIGHGVALSKVESGRVDKHPIKRLRTTASYLAVAMLGSETDRTAMRREIDGAHADVRSEPSDPVQYSAFDTDLQLWVAACLYRGMEDVYRLLQPTPSDAALDVLYRHGKRFGTTLQVREDQWPADRPAFEAYWNASLARIEYDEVTRPYLLGIADLSFLRAAFGPVGAVVAWALGPLNRFFTAGFLSQPFREKLGLPWGKRRQHAFDAVTHGIATVIRRLPPPLRLFPFNVYLRDTTVLVSRADGTAGAKANGFEPAVSADGRFVAFVSSATNVHPDDPDFVNDVFLRDLVQNTTVLVSRAPGADGAKGDRDSSSPAVSADGRFVAFASAATNVHPDDLDATWTSSCVTCSRTL